MKKGFNFLKPQVEAPSKWSRIYNWITGTARAILILFEIAVVIALVVRIIVDVQSKSIDEQIKTLEAIMEQRTLEEQKYVKLQAKTKAFSTMWTTGQIYSEVYDLINSYIPPSATSFNTSLETSKISVSGRASNNDIRLLENGLKESSLFKDTKLSMLEVKDNNPNTLSRFQFNSVVENIKFRSLAVPNSELIEE